MFITSNRLSILSFSSLVRVITAGLLFYALKRHAYDYYTLLRWVTFGVAGYSAFLAFRANKNEWGIVLGLLALLFNPIFPVQLHRNTWAYIDVVAGVVLLASLFFVQEKNSEIPDEKETGKTELEKQSPL